MQVRSTAQSGSPPPVVRVVDATRGVAAGPPDTPPVGPSAPAGMRALYWAAADGNSMIEAAARWAADKLRVRSGGQSSTSVIAYGRASEALVRSGAHLAGSENLVA